MREKRRVVKEQKRVSLLRPKGLLKSDLSIKTHIKKRYKNYKTTSSSYSYKNLGVTTFYYLKRGMAVAVIIKTSFPNTHTSEENEFLYISAAAACTVQ
jgi:hypothetical protein